MGRYWPDAQTTTQKHYFYVIFFSSFTQQWEQNANLQPASLWSIKWWRWSICGHIAICLNLINSTEEATVYCWRLVNKWKSSSGSSLWWTYDSSLRIMIRYGHFWKRRSFFFFASFYHPMSPGMTRHKKKKVSSCDVHGLLMIHCAFAAETLHSALPIDMVIPCMFMHTYIFSFQRATTNAWDECNIWKIGHCW